MKSIFVSAGHSNVDPGAVAFGRKEADIAVEFRNLVAFYLHRHNADKPEQAVDFDLDGAGAVNMPLSQAAGKARKYDLSVEFHCNAGPANAGGAETLSARKDMALGAEITAALAKVLNIRDRGAKPEDAGQHHRLAFVSAGGIIVELFFITNAGDLRQYDARKWLAAKAVAEVLVSAAGGSL